MKLAVSNIAWRVDEADAALDRLEALGVPGLEIAPSLAFAGEADPFRPSPAAITAWRADVQRRGMTLVSMQSLLFGQAEAALFGDEAGRRAFEAGIEAAIDLAGELACPNLVLGSPTARRIPANLCLEGAESMAQDVIGRLGDRCRSVGATLSLEPNPVAYGTNFLNTFAETAAFAQALDHPAVRVNLDIGASTMNGEMAAVLSDLTQTVGLIGHVHISEPNLVAAPADTVELARILAALLGVDHDGWASIEMRATDGDNLDRLSVSVGRAQAALTRSEGALE
ncbi:sugar phosphate isomerase/epimerase family protein [Brevundimonas bacteroides]|uniref:sugar phosphate isomerase/epimerase family protein n=1 Tax=Brevundimonas bacteroides TaxID=74311 RepID=UPI000496C57E|nr:sugar phosphate isomerase/epimerase family protein [Brevundimonas bacteroides]